VASLSPSLLGSARLDFVSHGSTQMDTDVLESGKKENNEMEPSFLRSCFPNFNFPARFL